MTSRHPVTPTFQQIDNWFTLPLSEEERLAAAFAAGADMELEACIQLLDINGCPGKWVDMLRAARRPKPTTLKEQALEQLREVNAMLQFQTTGGETSAIRRALEALDD